MSFGIAFAAAFALAVLSQGAGANDRSARIKIVHEVEANLGYQPGDGFITSLIAAWAALGTPGRAGTYLPRIEVPAARARAICIVGKALAAKRHIANALRLAKQLKYTRSEGCIALAVTWVQALDGDEKAALATLAGANSRIYAALLSDANGRQYVARALASGRHFTKALIIAARLPSHWSKSIAFVAIAKRQYDARLKVNASRSLGLAARHAALIQDGIRRRIALKSAAEESIRHGALRAARKMLVKLKQSILVRPNHQIRGDQLFETAKLQVAAGDGNAAMATLERAFVASMKTPRTKFPPVATEIVRWRAYRDGPPQALRMALRIQERRLRELALAEVAGAVAYSSDTKKALTMFDGFKSDRTKDKARARIAEALARRGQYERALTIVTEIKTETCVYVFTCWSHRNDPLWQIALIAVHAGDIRAAERAALAIPGSASRARTWADIVGVWSLKGHPEEAAHMIRRRYSGRRRYIALLRLATYKTPATPRQLPSRR